MGFGGRAHVWVMVLGISVAAAQAPPPGGSGHRPAATPERAALYLERSSAQLERLVAAIQKGTAAEVDEALKRYTRAFSQFQVMMAKLRIGRQELGFATRIVDGLDSQISRLEAVREDLQPSRAVAVSEALSHLKSALKMITQKLDANSRSRPKLGEAGPRTPGARLSR